MKKENDLKKLATRKYVFAMTTLFLVLVALLFIQKKIIQKEEQYAHIINVSGRQRMLSQQMSLLVYEINASENKQSALAEFNGDRVEFLSANMSLGTQDKTLQSMIDNYFILAEKAMTDKKALAPMSDFAKHQLLPKLNNIVLKYEHESQNINNIQKYFLIIVVLVLMMLILVGTILIFNPLQNLYHKMLIDLETERLKAFHAAKMATLGEMAGGIAHEINNPLSLIQGLSKILQRQIKDENIDHTAIEGTAEKIEAMTTRISKIVKNLSNFSRGVESDPMSDFSLKKIITDTVELCADRFRSHNIKIDLQIETEGLAFCREVQISQVLLNLLNNSYDAIENDREKWIRIQAKESEYLFEIIVTDSGNGISQDICEKIMQPFFTTKEKGKGTGLGLSISKGIIKDHFGQLVLNPHSPHTQFIIKLPKKEFICSYGAFSEA